MMGAMLTRMLQRIDHNGGFDDRDLAWDKYQWSFNDERFSNVSITVRALEF